MKEKEIGFVSNYFGNISVAAIEITGGKISIGDTIHFRGFTTDFKTKVKSMQMEHESIANAKKGNSIGIKVSKKVRTSDKVFIVLEE